MEHYGFVFFSATHAVMNPLLVFDTSVWNAMLAKKSICARDAIATALLQTVSQSSVSLQETRHDLSF
jgi:hypothetical protein